MRRSEVEGSEGERIKVGEIDVETNKIERLKNID